MRHAAQGTISLGEAVWNEVWERWDLRIVNDHLGFDVYICG
jgi:hypothetical protein